MSIHLSTLMIRLRDGILILITHQKKGDKAYDQNFNWTLLIRLFFIKGPYESLESINNAVSVYNE